MCFASKTGSFAVYSLWFVSDKMCSPFSTTCFAVVVFVFVVLLFPAFAGFAILLFLDVLGERNAGNFAPVGGE